MYGRKNYSFQDAHNCIADFDENSSFFAVYDGHGGILSYLYFTSFLAAMNM